MGNQISSPAKRAVGETDDGNVFHDKNRFKSFPGSAILEKTFCGSIDTTDPAEYHDVGLASRILKRAEILCVSSPISSTNTDDDGNENNSLRSYYSQSEVGTPSTRGTTFTNSHKPIHPSSAMFARALVSEVTDNPKTMKPVDMALREKKLLKAQEAANRATKASSESSNKNGSAEAIASSRPVGTPGGVGPTNVLGSLAFACTGDEAAANVCSNDDAHRHATASIPPNGGFTFLESRTPSSNGLPPPSPYQVTIGLSLSRRYSGVGHPETVTRQTAFDFNELQDRQYKYVSGTDQNGWRAGGGEVGGSFQYNATSANSDISEPSSPSNKQNQSNPIHHQQEKIASPDTCYLPIIHIDCPNAEAVDGVITALASGEIFIPHMSISPEALSVSGISPPDLVVRFGCERNDDVPPDEWTNWCLEFMHNQLYEYFYNYGARWMKRPFSITLARSVRWKTVKHMNRYFAHAEHVIEAWRERGPQFLDPQLSYIDGGATPEEVARPHGIYLFRTGKNGIGGSPTNYFSPNFDQPYTTKMTRSLVLAVLSKSWDKKRREWAGDPMPRLVEPATLLAAACGCNDPSAGGFLAKEVTMTSDSAGLDGGYNTFNLHVISEKVVSSRSPSRIKPQAQAQRAHHKGSPTSKQQMLTASEAEFRKIDDNDDGEASANLSLGSADKRNCSKFSDDDNTHGSEEKKSDEPAQSILASFKKASQRQRSIQRFGANTSYLTDDSYDGPVSVTTSGYETSVAASGATVPRTNRSRINQSSSSEKTQQMRGTDDSQTKNSEKEKELFCDEDWDGFGVTPRQNDHDNGLDEGSDVKLAFQYDGVGPSTPPWSASRQGSNSDPLGEERSPSNSNTRSSATNDSRVDRFEHSKADKCNDLLANFTSASSTTIDESGEEDIISGRYGRHHALRQKKSPKESLKQEQDRQAALVAKARNVTEKDNMKNHLHSSISQMESSRAHGAAAAYSMPSSFHVGKNGTGKSGRDGAIVEQTFSGTSLEYSTDGSSAFLAQDQSSSNSLIGPGLLQHTDGYSSVGPALSKNNSSFDSDSLLHDLTKDDPRKNKLIPKSSTSSNDDDNDSLLRDGSKIGDTLGSRDSISNDSDSLLRGDDTPLSSLQAKQNSSPSPSRNGRFSDKRISRFNSKEDTDSTANLSVQESASYATTASVIPTDEDLYLIGWAKALDSASGNYYYFTLDRSKTVWENPLSPHDGASSSWGDGNGSEVTSSSVSATEQRPRATTTLSSHPGSVDP